MKEIINFLRAFFFRYLYSPKQYALKVGVNIGKNCWIDTRDFSTEPYLITIGDNVQVTTNVTFLTHGGMWINRKADCNADAFGKIVIKSNTYIGMNSIILPGVTIGERVIIAAGSVISKSVPDGVIVGGNPAKIIGTTDNFIKKMEIYNVGTKLLTNKQKKKYLLTLDETMYIKKPYMDK